MEKLAQHLKDIGVGQNEFARLHGFDPSLLSRYVNGKVDIPLDAAVKIRDATDGAVPITAWPKLAAVIAAAQGAK